MPSTDWDCEGAMIKHARWDIVGELRTALQRVATDIHRQAKIEAYEECAAIARRTPFHGWRTADCASDAERIAREIEDVAQQQSAQAELVRDRLTRGVE